MYVSMSMPHSHYETHKERIIWASDIIIHPLHSLHFQKNLDIYTLKMEELFQFCVARQETEF